MIEARIQELWRGNWCLTKQHIHLKKGEGLVLTGPNGSGKTSALLALSTLIPFRGTYYSTIPLEKMRLKLMLQDGPNSIKVIDHLRFWQLIYGALPQDIEMRMELYGLKPYELETLETLSFGLNQRLALARLGLGCSQVWLIDEPFSGLDDKHTEKVQQDFNIFLQKGGSICITSHDNPMNWPELAITSSFNEQHPREHHD